MVDRVICTCRPSGTWIGELMRQYPEDSANVLPTSGLTCTFFVCGAPEMGAYATVSDDITTLCGSAGVAEPLSAALIPGRCTPPICPRSRRTKGSPSVTESNTQPEPEVQWRSHRKARARDEGKRFGRKALGILIGVAVVGSAVIFAVHTWHHAVPTRSAAVAPSVRYVGVFEPDTPRSYADIDQFARSIGRQPNIVPYYSHWYEPFDVGFATTAAEHGAVTLVQIAPQGVSLASIASGKYDIYLHSYALAVKAFGGRVILSFGHEMNGNWYSWGYKHTSPTVFVAAWRHVVDVFRAARVSNVTWMWTINIIGKPNIIPAPKPWWPGSSYVNWIGIDGYYWSSSAGFDSVFGPTIADVREFTSDPMLIAETGAEPSVGQPAKIADLFSGVRSFDLLGFIYFNDDVLSAAIPGEALNWRLSSPAALQAFRRNAKAYMKPATSSVSAKLNNNNGQ